MNNLDPEVAERPDDLVVYGGTGQGGAHRGKPSTRSSASCARSKTTRRCWCSRASRRRVSHARGRAAGADRELEPGAALGDCDEFRELEALGPHDVRADDRGLAGSTSARRASCRAPTRRLLPPRRRTFGGYPRGRLVAHGRARRHGRRAAAGGDHERRVPSSRRGRPRAHRSGAWRPRYLDERDRDLDEALAAIDARATERAALDRPVAATPPRYYPSSCARGITPDLVTDQTAAHDPLSGYVPARAHARSGSRAARAAIPRATSTRAKAIDGASQVRSDAGDAASAAPMVFDYGNNIRAQAIEAGRRATPSTFPGFVPAYIRPLFCEGKGPFRWVALSGDPDDIARHRRRRARSMFPTTRLWPLDEAGAGARRVPGPARAHLLARLRRARQGRACASTSWSARAKSRRRSSSAATTSTADSVASPYRETEGDEGRLRRRRRLGRS